MTQSCHDHLVLLALGMAD